MLNLFIFILFLAFVPCIANNSEQLFLEKLMRGIPKWMEARADRDLALFRSSNLSEDTILDYYETSPTDHYLIKFTIRDNQVYTESKEKKSEGVIYRQRAYEEALKTILKVVNLPNVVFLVSMHDAYTLSTSAPVFTMCKRSEDQCSILLPDFDALRAKFQVLPNQDLTVYEPLWTRKKDQLVWRGSTAQASLDNELMRPDNVHRFSRVILCQLSQQYPELIDAKFTFFAQGGERIPSLQMFKSKQMSYAKWMEYKYQLLIDGNVSPYSASGWKFFSNSLIFKPESSWIQWYYDALIPFKHYIPVQEDLSDLVEKILWAQSHDSDAMMLAKQCREFALSHITLPDNLLYVYHIIDQYGRLFRSENL